MRKSEGTGKMTRRSMLKGGAGLALGGVLVSDAAGGGQSASAQPADDGTFSIDVAADFDYAVRVTIAGDDRYGFVSPVRPGGTEVAVRLETGQSIDGTLEDGGAPASKRYLWLRGDRWSTSTRTDDVGKFKARALPPGRYTIQTWIEGANKQVDVGQADAGDADVKLHVPR